MIESNLLPNRWCESTLGEVCSLVTDGTHKTPSYVSSGIPFISIANIRPFKEISFDKYVKFITKEEHELLCKRAKPEKDDILFPRIGTLGYAKRIDFDFEVSIFVGLGLAKPIKSVINPHFLEYFLNTQFVYNFSHKNATGTGRLTLPLEVSRLLPLPLPPLAEQHRIVAKIEELFSEIDKGVESLKTAKQQLKVYRQAVLKYAFEGKLTNPDVKEGELPVGWVRKTLKELTLKAEKVKLKSQNPNEEFYYLDIGGIDNVRNRIVDYKTYRWANAPSRAQQIVKYKDILFSTVRTYLKNVAQVNDVKFDKQICSSGFTVIRANEDNDSNYLFKYVLYEGFLTPLNELQTGTSYPAVRDEDVLSQFITLPRNKEEQQLVVQEIESRLSVCDKIEESIEQGLQQAEALRQSILKKAFEGKLVPQDPNDEPASVLLERIKQERLNERNTGKIGREGRQPSTKARYPSTGRKVATSRQVKTTNKSNNKDKINN